MFINTGEPQPFGMALNKLLPTTKFETKILSVIKRCRCEQIKIAFNFTAHAFIQHLLNHTILYHLLRENYTDSEISLSQEKQLPSPTFQRVQQVLSRFNLTMSRKNL